MRQPGYVPLRHRRLNAGFSTASVFARSIGVDAELYRKLERGNRLLKEQSSKVQLAIANGLHCALGDLVSLWELDCTVKKISKKRIEQDLARQFGSKLQPVRCRIEERNRHKSKGRKYPSW